MRRAPLPCSGATRIPASPPAGNSGDRSLPGCARREAVRAAELDLADDLRRRPRGDHAWREVARDDRIGSDDAALADRHPRRDHAVHAEPAVVADPRRSLRREPLPRDGHRAVVVAVRGVRDEAVVGEHHVAADRDLVLGRDHGAEIQEGALADRDAALVADSDPTARLEEGLLADREAAVVERLEHVALDREADEGLGPEHVGVDAQTVPGELVALVPAPLLEVELEPRVHVSGARYRAALLPPPAGSASLRSHALVVPEDD